MVLTTLILLGYLEMSYFQLCRERHTTMTRNPTSASSNMTGRTVSQTDIDEAQSIADIPTNKC